MNQKINLMCMLLLFTGVLQAQNLTIRGVVVDENDQPLVGASVTVKGTTQLAVVNVNGQYSLANVPANATLVAAFMGYRPSEAAVSGRAEINFKLQPDASVLEAAVITGFQQFDRANFTGSAVKVKMDDIKAEGVIDVSRMLEGRAAGVSVQNVSGTFGTAPKIRVRGVTSLYGENKPLWVVDGVIYEDVVNISNDQLSSGDPMTLLGSAVAGLNANDIESFDILKDAAATALYGARAMNGVIVITTKKGQEGKPVVRYSGNYSVQLKPRYDQYNIMNSADQMSILAELDRKGYLTTSILNNSNWGVYGKMFYELNNYDPISGTFGLENTPEAKRAFLERYAYANTDWFDILFRNSFVQEHSVNFTSGSQNSRTYASVSMYNDNGWTVADAVTRYTLNFRNDYTINKRVDVAVGATAFYRDQKSPGAQDRLTNTVAGQYERTFDVNPFSYALNTSRAMTLYDDEGNPEYFQRNYAPFNILDELEKNYMKLTQIEARLHGEATVKIVKNLKFTAIGAIRYNSAVREHMIEEGSNMAEAYRAAGNSTIRSNNRNLYSNPDTPNEESVVVLPYGGMYYRFDDNLLSYDVRGSFFYNAEFNVDHKVNAMLGMQARSADRQRNSLSGFGYQYNSGGIPYIDPLIIKKETEASRPYYTMQYTKDRGAAVYATVDYMYKNRYSVAATTRYEGSNQLGSRSSARWLPTWTISGKWNAHSEQFMQPYTWLDNLSLKASYGLVADIPPRLASTVAYFSPEITRRPLTSETESALSLESVANDELTWQKAYSTNIALDLAVLNSRITLTSEYWMRNGYDLISRINTSGIGGEVTKWANYADMKSHGIDISLGLNFIRTRDWSWRMNAIFGYATNEITRSEELLRIFDLVRETGGNRQGYPVSSLFSIKFEGLDEYSMPLFIDENGNLNNSVYIQSRDTDYVVYEGPVDPPYNGGINNTIRFKDFTLNLFFSYQFGNKIRLYPTFRSSYSDSDALPKEFFDRWTLPGDGDVTTVPGILDRYRYSLLGSSYPYNAYNYSEERVAKGDFIRLKSVSLTYTVPSKALSTLGIKGASITLSGHNLWMLYSDKKLKGQDPEFYMSGGVSQPLQQQITCSLNVTF